MSRPGVFIVVGTLCAAGALAAVLTLAPVADSRSAAEAPRRTLLAELDTANIDGGFFTVWAEAQRGPFTDIAGARLSLDGGWLDAQTPLPIARGELSQRSPAIACGLGLCAVVYVQAGVGPVLLRLDESGARRDPTPVVLDPSSVDPGSVDVAFDGTRFMATWVERADVFAATFDATGAPSPVITISNSSDYEGNAVLAGLPGTFLITWDALGAAHVLRMQRVSSAGVLMDATSTVATGLANAGQVRVASDGAQWLITWPNDTGAFEGPLLGRRVSAGGAFVGVAFELAPGSGTYTTRTSLAFDGLAFVLSANHFAATALELQLLRISTTGTLLSATTLSNSLTNFTASTVASHGGRGVVLWVDEPHDLGFELVGQRFNDVGLPLRGTIELPRVAASHAQLALAANPQGFFTAWTDDSTAFDGGQGDVLGALAGLDGSPQGAPFVVANGSELQAAVGVGADDVGFWAAYRSTPSRYADDRLEVVGVSSSGVVSPPLIVSQQGCCTDHVTFVETGRWTWALFGAFLNGNFGFGARVSRDAGLLDPADRVLVNDAQGLTGAWAARSGTLLLAWIANGSLFTQRFDDTGTPREATPTTVYTGYAREPVVASDGQDFVVAWLDVSERLFTQRIDGATGQPVGARVQHHGCCDLASVDQDGVMTPRLTFDGTGFQLVWGRVTSADAGVDVWLTELDLDGGVSVPSRVLISGASDDFSPQLATASPGRVGLASLAFDVSRGAVRTELRVLAAVPQGARCVATNECLSGQCLRGVCCDADGGGCALEADAGAGTDAGGSPFDGGEPDAGLGDDAGQRPMSDAGGPMGPDGGAPPLALSVGCGCQALDASLGVLALVLVSRRRGGRAFQS